MLKTIKQGASGDLVKVAQYLTGYAARKETDGIFNADFVAHVCAWQRKYGLSADGIIGPKTWAKIADKAPTCSTAKNKRSAATCAVQILLVGLAVDGTYGEKTKKAVAAYQAAKGLSADGICGSKTWAALIEGATAAASDGFVQPVDYKQYDSRWGSIVYSATGKKSQTIKSSGCGPTAMSNIVATLKDSGVTPPMLCELALKWGDRTADNGTAWSFFDHIQQHYGFSKMVKTTSIATLKACLDAGGYAVASMGPGYWTSGGHFITIWKYDSSYIYANDPASSKRKKQQIADFMNQRKRFFCFYK